MQGQNRVRRREQVINSQAHFAGDICCDADHALKHVLTQDASFPARRAPGINMYLS